MKKLLILAALVTAAVSSCTLEDVYVRENVQDLVTYTEGKLINDVGTIFDVKESQVAQSEWKVESQRQLIRFDILNRQMEIRLLETHPLTKVIPEEYQVEEELPTDPVVFDMGFISGGYMNLVFAGYKAKGSNFAPQYYFRQVVRAGSIKVYLYYDGNNENPLTMALDDLETKVYYVCIPLENAASLSSITLEAYRLQQDDKGAVYCEPYVYDFISNY